MYVGRLLLVGTSKSGGIIAAYRLASRSFPHRKIQVDTTTKTAHVMPVVGYDVELQRNRHLTYPCLHELKSSVLIANGHHLTDICEKITQGTPPARAMTQVLSDLGPEPDTFQTPRIVGLANQKEHLLGIVTENSLSVQSFPNKPGLAYYIATYIKTQPSMLRNFDVKNSREAAKTVHEGGIFRTFTHPVCTIASFSERTIRKLSVFPS